MILPSIELYSDKVGLANLFCYHYYYFLKSYCFRTLDEAISILQLKNMYCMIMLKDNANGGTTLKSHQVTEFSLVKMARLPH
jgi:hypothetical protein